MVTNKRYENFIVFLAPLINSVGGIAIDLYAPSIPSIGRELDASPSLMQNTITITLLCYAIGQLFFGILADAKGRRPAVILGLGLFLGASVMAATSSAAAMPCRAATLVMTATSSSSVAMSSIRARRLEAAMWATFQ